MKKAAAILLVLVLLFVGIPLLVRKVRSDAAVREARELGVVLEEEIRAWETRPRKRPPLFPPAVEGTAWEYYHRAVALVDKTDEELNLGEFRKDQYVLNHWDGPHQPLPEGSERYLKELEPALELLRRGASTAESGVASDLRRGMLTSDWGDVSTRVPSSFEPPLDELRARAVLAISRGDPSGGVDWLRTADRMGEDLARGGAGLEHLMGFTIRVSVAEDLAVLVGAGRLPDDQVECIEAWVREDLEPPPPGWERMEGSYLLTQVELLRLAEGHDMLSGLFRSKWYVDLVMDLIEPGQVQALVLWRQLREDYSTLTAADPAGDDAAFSRVAAALRAKQAGRPRAYTFFIGGVAEYASLDLKLRGGLREAREVVLLNAALFRHRVREGKDPETIAEILPKDVRKTTSNGPWDWRSAPDLPHRWIERGPLADIQAQKAEDLERTGKLLEGTGVLEEGTITGHEEEEDD